MASDTAREEVKSAAANATTYTYRLVVHFKGALGPARYRAAEINGSVHKTITKLNVNRRFSSIKGTSSGD